MISRNKWDTLANTSINPKSKLSPSDEDIVELCPPVAFGFSGTAKFYRVADAAMIAELLKRGYVVVDRGDDD
jgi:hypothetical protein